MAQDANYTSNSTPQPTSSVDESSSIRHVSSSNEGEDVYEPSTIVKVILSLWLLCIIYCICRNRCTTEQTQQDLYETEQQSRREMSEGEKEKEKRTLEERHKLIAAATISRKVVRNDGTGLITLSTEVRQGCDDKDNNETLMTDSMSGNEDTNKNMYVNEDTDALCQICLQTFDAHDDLSWSREMTCRHIFHTKCIITWLTKSDSCPACRTNIIVTKDTIINTIEADEMLEQNGEGFADGGGGAFAVINGLVTRIKESGFSFLRRASSNLLSDDKEIASTYDGKKEQQVIEV